MKAMRHAWVLVLVAAFPALAGSTALPEKAASVIRANFPDARVTGVGRERERGAWYYEVVLKEGKRRTEVEVTEEGVIGEIECKVSFGDLPQTLQAKVRERVGGGRLVRIERHERRGIARSGVFVPIREPRISYEVKYYDRLGQRHEMQLASNAVLEVPEAVLTMVGRDFPAARIGEAEVEDDEGVLLYVLSLLQEQRRFTVVASREGQLVENEVPLAVKALPEAAWKYLSEHKVGQRGDELHVSGWQTYLAVEDGKLVNRRDQSYVVLLERKGRAREYRFDGRGKMTSRGDWQDMDDDDDDDGEDDDDD